MDRISSWVIIAPFINDSRGRWLDDFIDDSRLVTTKIATPRKHENWHARKSTRTSAAEWLTHLKHAFAAYRRYPSGIVTSFPQLAMCTALLKKIGRAKPALIAYNYNLGELRPGIRQKLARFVAGQIDIYVVHSPHEIDSYARYLNIPPDRVRFVPLQRGAINIPRKEDTSSPFILAMGSAKRDYPTLIRAVEKLGIPTVIVTRKVDIEKLPQSRHVRFMSDLTQQECLELLARARISVTPLSNMITASGQITFLNAMQLGVPVIATRSPGTDGYIEHGQNGFLVEASNAEELAAAITSVWNDEDLRHRLAEQAHADAVQRFSDEAAAEHLRQMMLDLASD